MTRFILTIAVLLHASVNCFSLSPSSSSLLFQTKLNTPKANSLKWNNPITLRQISTSRKSQPGDELFPAKGTSYIPSGLSEQEYAIIKKKEQDQEKKLNFGMWGPRFAQTSTPDGDWMVQPGLWTSGFGLRKTQSNGDGIAKPTQLGEWIEFTQRHALAFFSVFAFTQFLQYAYILAASVLTGSMTPSFNVFPQISVITSLSQQMTKLIYSNWKLLIVKVLFAGCFACPTEIFVFQRLNRHKLWSKKRSFFTLNGFGLLGLLSWSGIISGISFCLS